MSRRGGLSRRAIVLAYTLRFFVRTAGEAAARRALPLYLAIGIAAVVLFGGNGMDAATVTRRSIEDWGFRWLLLASWTLATLPAASAWLGTSETFFVRALPVSRATVAAVLASGLSLVHLPWLLLWLRGGTVVAALWAVTAASALQTLTIAGVRGRADAAMLLVAVTAACVRPGHASAIIAAASATFFMNRAWSRAPERALGGRGWVSSRGPLRAETTALAVALCRGHAALLFRAALIALAAAWVAYLGISHGAADELGTTSLGLLLWVPAATFGAAALAGPLLRIERSLDWLARSSGAPRRIYFAPALLLILLAAIGGAGFAAIVTGAASLGARAGLALTAACAAAGAAAAAMACTLARRALRDDGGDAGRLVLTNLGSVSAWIAAIVTLGARAVPLMVLIALAALARERKTWRAGSFGPCSP
jgi:hypothetical protein